MPSDVEREKVVNLVGSPQNPAREPRKRPPTGAGSIGDTALKDGIIIVGLCWVVLIALMFSLRSHNI